MRILVTILILACTFFGKTHPFGFGVFPDVSETVEAISIGKEIIEGVVESWGIVHKLQHDQEDNDNVGFIGVKRIERELLRRLGHIGRRIDAVDKHIEMSAEAVVSRITSQTISNTLLEARLDRMSTGLLRIAAIAKTVQEYAKAEEEGRELEQLTLHDFAVWAVGQRTGSIQDTLENIHGLVVPQDRGLWDRGVLGLLQKSLQVYFIMHKFLRNR